MAFFRLFCLLFTIYLTSFFLQLILDISFGESLPLSYIVCTFITYLCSLLGGFSYYKYLFPVFFLFYFTYIVFYIKKKKYKIFELAKRLTKPSIIFFTMIFIYLYYLYIYYYNRDKK